MPIAVYERSLTGQTPEYFSKVTSQDADIHKKLVHACDTPAAFILFEAHFNGSPIAFCLADREQHLVDTLIVHPATRARGVGKDLLDQSRKQYQDATGAELALPEHCQPR